MHSVASMTTIEREQRKTCTYVHLFAYDTYTEMEMGRIMSISFLFLIYLGSFMNGKAFTGAFPPDRSGSSDYKAHERTRI